MIGNDIERQLIGKAPGAEEGRHHEKPVNTQDRDGHDDDDDDDDDDDQCESNLLFSCQCDSARKVATLLSCLRRVVTVGNPSTSTMHQHNHHQYVSGVSQSIAAARAVAGGSSHKIQHATVYAGPDGLTFHVQHGLAKQAQCSVDLPKTMFRDYFVGEEEVWVEDSDEDDDDGGRNAMDVSKGRATKEIIQGGEFSVNLTTLLDCFSILSKTGNKPVGTGADGSNLSGGSRGNTSTIGGHEYSTLSKVPLCMSYDRGTATLHLELLENGCDSGGGCLVTCEIPGVAVADDVDDGPGDCVGNQFHQNETNSNACYAFSGLATAFRSSPIQTRAILLSDTLQPAVTELYDVPGAKVVYISLSKKGLEFGTIGPRSEVWINLPYHVGQEGLYIGLESYNHVADDGSVVRKYPLGAFLSGMRGLDIGVETCISVNARGIMAIQHQVSRGDNLDSGRVVRPSFVDFIMTCIEDEEDDIHNVAPAQREEGARVRRQHIRSKTRLQDITNNELHDDGKKLNAVHARPRDMSDRCAAQKSPISEKPEFALLEEETEYNITNGNSKSPENAPICRDNATSRLLEELEVGTDLMSSNQMRAPRGQSRKFALEDIRRRRRERQQHLQSFEFHHQNIVKMSDNDVDDNDTDTDSTCTKHQQKSNANSDVQKRHSENFDTGSYKNRRSLDVGLHFRTDNQGMGNKDQSDSPLHHSTLAQDTQSESDVDEDDETELEDALDVTAENPLLFSKRNSTSTKALGNIRKRSFSKRNNDRQCSDFEEEQEPRMMYGDTKLEFTQDSYDSS